MARAARLALAVLAGLLVGIGIDVSRAGNRLDWQALHGLVPPYEARGRQVDIGERSLYLDCRGSGSPTVVLEAGAGSDAGGWGLVFPAAAERTRACAYDRAGRGRSEPRGVHDAADVAADLRAVLDAAGEQPPFVVVGHSLGGVYGRVFVSAHREEVAGLVLVDSFNPDIFAKVFAVMPPAQAAAWRDFLEPTFAHVEQLEDLDWDRTAAQLEAASVDGVPVEVVVVRQTYDGIVGLDPATVEAMYATWRDEHEALSDEVRMTILTDSGHLVQLDKPSAVVDAIERLLEQARAAGG